MAIVFRGKTKCGLCSRTIEEEQDIVAFPHFLDPGDPLYRYSDAAFHASCFSKDPNKDELERAFAELQSIWSERPLNARTDEERQAFAKMAAGRFQAYRRKQQGLA